MKPELTDILVCPLCKKKLRLTTDKKDAKEIVDGFLFCRNCNVSYPIIDTIPNLLPQGIYSPRHSDWGIKFGDISTPER
jgi:uncharacterized protein